MLEILHILALILNNYILSLNSICCQYIVLLYLHQIYSYPHTKFTYRYIKKEF